MTVLNSGTQVYNQTVLNSDRQVYNEVVLNVQSSKCVVVSELKYCGLVQSPVEAGLFVPRAVWPKKKGTKQLSSMYANCLGWTDDKDKNGHFTSYVKIQNM